MDNTNENTSSESKDPDELVISLEDLASPSVEQSVERLQESAKPQLVRTVGATQSRSPWRNPLLLNSLVGLVGALVSSILIEIISQPDSNNPWYGTSGLAGDLIYFGGFALFLGVAFSFADSIESRSASKVWRTIGLGAALMVGPIIVLGFIAHTVYYHLWDNYLIALLQGGDQAVYAAQGDIRHHIIRGLAWGIVAMAMGIGLGFAKRSGRAVVNGLSAGLLGGFIGGFVFDYINFGSAGTASRVVADVIIGLLVGLSLGLISEITKQHWIEIVSGGMAGKQFIVFSSVTKVGSSPSADITLIKDASIAPLQFELRASGATLGITPLSGDFGTTVNGMRITPGQSLRDGDLVEIGTTVLRYRSKSEEMPTLK
jgi:hypothetical protein